MNSSSNNRSLENEGFKRKTVGQNGYQKPPKTGSKNKGPDNYPLKEDAVALMRRMGLPHNIVEHQLAVMRKARDIAHNIVHAKVDNNLVKMGALVHDIGRVQDHSLAHAYLGGDILRNLGYPEAMARIAEKHALGGITEAQAVELGLPPRDYVPRTIEEKIVCLADKYFSGKVEVTIEDRFAKWTEKFGENEFLREQIRRVRALEDEILHLIYD